MNKITEQQSRQIATRYRDGESSTLLAKAFDVSVPCIFQHLRRNKIKSRDSRDAARIYDLKHDYFSTIDSHEKAQLLGMLYADGNVSRRHFVTEIQLHETDRYYLEYMKRSLGYTGPLYRMHRKDFGTYHYRLSISSRQMHADLVKTGMVPAKSLVLTFPRIPDEFVSSFVLGYFEGDGSISVWDKKGGGFDANVKICVTREFGETLRNILSARGIGSCLFLGAAYRKRFVNMFSLGISGTQQVKALCEWMYLAAPFRMTRKHDVYTRLLSYYDKDGNIIKTNGWLEQRRQRCEETFARNGTRPGVKAVRQAYYVKDDTIYHTNNIGRFAKDMGLTNSEAYNLADLKRKTPHRGWSLATPDQIASARTNGTLVTKFY